MIWKIARIAKSHSRDFAIFTSTKRIEGNKMSFVLNAADKTNFWIVWDKIDEAIPTGNKYLNNMEMHYCEMRNMEAEGKTAEEIARHFGYETLEAVFKSVANQAEEDFELRSFG